MTFVIPAGFGATGVMAGDEVEAKGTASTTPGANPTLVRIEGGHDNSGSGNNEHNGNNDSGGGNSGSGSERRRLGWGNSLPGPEPGRRPVPGSSGGGA